MTILITQYLGLGVLIFGFLGAIFPEFFKVFAPSVSFLLGTVMFSMGLTLSLKDFKEVLSRPLTIALAVLMQFLLMPVLALTTGILFNLDLMLAAGFILVGSCPGGTASNVLTYLAKGNVALSVTITAITTLLSPLVTPILTYTFVGKKIDLEMSAMMLDICKMVLFPVLLGIIVNRLLDSYVNKVKQYIPVLSALTIMFIVAIVVSMSAKIFNTDIALIALAISFYIVIAIVLAYAISKKICNFDSKTSITIALEIAVQNSGMGAVLALKYFSAYAAVPAAIFSVLQNVICSLIISITDRFSSKQDNH